MSASPQPPLGLRERHKERRRRLILEAARELIRERPETGIATEAIAARAEVSTATVYNLVGTRRALLQALLNERMQTLADEVTDLPHEDPLVFAERTIERIAQLLVADAVVHRHVVRALSDADRHGVHYLRQDVRFLLDDALVRASECKLLAGPLDPKWLSWQVYLGFLGALHSWAQGDRSDREFALDAAHGFHLVLAAAAPPRRRSERLRRVVELQTQFGPDGGTVNANSA
jgi:AcrR family transcriptional regulator